MTLDNKVALVTGSAKRVGAACIKALHAEGANVVIHFNQSKNAAEQLAASLNASRANSAVTVGTQLDTHAQAELCIEKSLAVWNRLDIVVNNASSFFPTPMGDITDADVANLIGSNVSAPLFITQAAQAELAKRQGSVINLVDIHGFRPHDNHVVYSAAKAALAMLTQSMAKELAPRIRVNGIAPGAILWPEDGSVDEDLQQQKIAEIPLQRQGAPEDIARLVVYLCSDAANFITGQIIKVDGGRSI